MDQGNKENTETVGDKTFEELVDLSLINSEQLEPGQEIKARIVKITESWIFIDLGGKSEGYLDKKELLDKEGKLTVQEGDTIHAYLLSSDNNENLFTTRVGKGSAGRSHLKEAWRSSIPVEGNVEKEVKGGFEVIIAGQIRAFCPYSQMGLRRQDNTEQYVGQRLAFKIVEYTNNGRNIIVSNREILNQEFLKQKDALKESLQEGSIVKGTITSIRDFGAFVDIGGIEGLLPISEVGWDRVDDINKALAVGQEVEVAVLKLDWEKERFSFSLKKTLPDPWEKVAEKFSEGSCCTGKVARLTKFGAFVTLAPGVDGLVHISNLQGGKRINHPRDVLAEGQEIEVKVEGVDPDKKRISLLLSGVEQEQQRNEHDREDDYKQYLRKGKKDSSQSLGTLGDILKAKLAEKMKEGKKDDV
jgi:small subunit ribosomal protein S1